MSISTEGVMCVAVLGENIENLSQEFIESNDLCRWSPYYDAPLKDCFIGYYVPNIDMRDISVQWMNEIRQLGDMLKEITGVTPTLMGIPHVY